MLQAVLALVGAIAIVVSIVMIKMKALSDKEVDKFEYVFKLYYFRYAKYLLITLAGLILLFVAGRLPV